ncbi:hypothetical protein GN958_ATG12715 [Phytophthora infestans]|uniref:Uncharacterized protein n=1 Tax=Phytophthora infestans TaxID=4787 RepID=A0A8S9UBR5_PHYIN|nr:hypothetical protein GN958_ATG12715 [Phytophthora infestans]
MTSALQLGELAFVGPTHSAQLNDFQYVEITDLTDSVATVKIVGPDDDKNNDTFDIPIDIESTDGHMALYTAAETTDILHIARVALTPVELLHRQDALLAACRKRRSGIPPSVLASLSVPFSPDEIVPLVKPATLQLVHVRRQHIVSYSNASRANKPEDLYTDTSHIVEESTTRKSTDEARKTPTPRSHPSTANEIDTQLRNYDSADVDNDSCSEDGDVREVQHMNAPLAKRRRFNDNDDESFSDSSNDSYADAERTTQRQRGIVFHPSPSDRRIHAAIVNRRHTGKNPQTLLQSVQQSLHVEFVASPAVLRALHKFGQHFYNSKTVDFISTAKDFVICYADHARPDLTMARLLAYWINEKFSLFRNKVLSDGLREATKVSTQFCRSDDKLGALRDSSQPWKPSSASRPRPANAETNVRTHRTTSNTGSRIPFDVYAQMPLGEDVRKLCLKFLSKPGCQFTKCSNAHFRPESLAEGVKNLISERWGGLSAQYSDL